MPSRRSITPLENRLSYRCLRLATRISRFMAPMWEEKYGLTTITWRVLAVIGRFGPMSAKQVAEHTSTDAFFVQRAIEQLVKLKLVSRGVDDHDRRRLKLELTEAGVAAKADVEKVLSRVEASLLEQLSAEDRQKMASLLETLDTAALSALESGGTWRDYTG